MSQKQKKIATWGVVALAALAVVVLAGLTYAPQSNAIPMEPNCSYNQDKHVTYYQTIFKEMEVGGKIDYGCFCGGSTVTWGQTSSYSEVTCTSCSCMY